MPSKASKVKKVQGTKYTWQELSGLRPLLAFGDGKTVVDDVEVETNAMARERDTNIYNVFSPYGDRLQWIDAAVEYSDGSILLCAHISAWGGTFGEDTNKTKYYALIPK